MPAFSVIVPIYNVEPFLAECIDSVRAQTFTDWELILVNDGSPDNSDRICKQYAKLDARIKYIKQKNAGVSVARNHGMKMATGDWLFFMDSDDTISPDFLAASYKTATESGADIIVVGKYFARRMPLPAALPVCATVVRRKLISGHSDICFPAGVQPCEDGIFSHKCITQTDKLALCSQPIYNYRTHPGQNHINIDRHTDKILASIPKWWDILSEFYNKHNLWHTHAAHFARFLDQETFSFRYLAMPFSPAQREHLFKIMHDFYNRNLRPYMTDADYKTLSRPFRLFIRAKSPRAFKHAYRLCRKKRQLILLGLHLLPIGRGARERLREKINRAFEPTR